MAVTIEKIVEPTGVLLQKTTYTCRTFFGNLDMRNELRAPRYSESY
jgi:hypothetical protein